MVREKLVLRKEVKKLIRKTMYTTIIFLIGMILVKQNPSLKNIINEKIYTESPNYLKAKKLYKKYFGSIIPQTKNTSPVFTEKLNYTKSTKYANGVKLKVSSNYLVPTIESGIVIYLDKEKIIVSQIDGINVEYKNITIKNYKLYDYIEKGTLLGETITDELYLTFEKDGEYLDYKKYI